MVPGFGAVDVTWRSSDADASSPTAPADAAPPVHCSSPWEPAITANDGCLNGSPDAKRRADPAAASRQHPCLPRPAPHMPDGDPSTASSISQGHPSMLSLEKPVKYSYQHAVILLIMDINASPQHTAEKLHACTEGSFSLNVSVFPEMQ